MNKGIASILLDLTSPTTVFQMSEDNSLVSILL